MYDIEPRILQAFSLFMAKKDIRHYLTGMRIESKSGKLYISATDGHALMHGMVCENESAPDFLVIVPRLAIEMAIKQKGKKGAFPPLKIAITSERIGMVVFEPIKSTYPDIYRVIPHKISDDDLMKEAAIINPELMRRIVKADAIIRRDSKCPRLPGLVSTKDKIICAEKYSSGEQIVYEVMNMRDDSEYVRMEKTNKVLSVLMPQPTKRKSK